MKKSRTQKTKIKPANSQGDFSCPFPSINSFEAYLAVDQSLASTGMAIISEAYSLESVHSLLSVFWGSLSEGEKTRRLEAFADAWKVSHSRTALRLKDSTVVTPIAISGRWSSGPRKTRKLLCGVIMFQDGKFFLLASSRIPVEATDLPEWEVADKTSRQVALVTSELSGYAAINSVKDIHVSFESLAQGGSKLTARILPVLGIVWGAMFSALNLLQMILPDETSLTTWEFQISSWKKSFTGNGKAEKSDIEKTLLRMLTLSHDNFSFETTDESDALAMAILLASKKVATASLGRIRPPKKTENLG
jgi:hypothetical protein